MFRKSAVLLFAVSTLVCSIALGEEAHMFVQREAVNMKTHAAAPRIVQDAQLPHAATLDAAVVGASEQLEAMRAWNAQGRLPARNGIRRMLGDTVEVHVGALAAKSGRLGRGVVAATTNGVAWGTSFHVESAERLRLHLEDVELPEGTTLWVYGNSGEAVAFDASLLDDKKALWTPSVTGDTVYLEIEVPAGATTEATFRVREVLELAALANLRARGDDAPTCLVGQDVNCQTASEFSVVAQASRAIGYMEFAVSGGSAVCSGALITDQQQSGTPYFLTANHCIATQSSASSLETYFDYKYLSCVSSQTSFQPKVVGSTLLVTSATSDVTLLRLPSLPSGRVLLGWNSDPSAVPTGTVLHRISHPFPDGNQISEPQTYSRTTVTTGGPTCSTRSRTNYVYSNESPSGEGGVYGGSSGSSVMLGNGQIVGQLFGSCGPDPAAGCDRRNNTLDGAFAVSFNSLRTHLSSSGSTPSPCTPNSSTICLVNNRFSVRLTYDVGQGPQPMTAIKYTGETGLFWFTDAGNIEVLLKMINACSFNQKFWVYAGGTTDVGVNITVTDSQTGAIKTYNNVRGTKFVTITDGSAFSCP